MDTFNKRIMNMISVSNQRRLKMDSFITYNISYYFIDIASCITIRIGISSVFAIMYPGAHHYPMLPNVFEVFQTMLLALI